MEEPQDSHPFAWYRVLDEDGAEVGISVRKKLWAQTEKHLAGFSGRTREIGGQPYLSWTDYLQWRGRRCKGDLTTGFRQGLVLSNWNRGVPEKGDLVLDEVKVGRLDCYADGYHHQTYLDVAQLVKALHSRENLLAAMDTGKHREQGDRRLRGKAQQWREMVEDYLRELYALHVTFDLIKQRYFGGQLGLFPRSAHALSQLVEHAEKLVNVYNQDITVDLELLANSEDESAAQGSESRHTIDPSNLLGKTRGAATDEAGYLVDMAKAEALDAMGETERASRVVDKHI